MAKEMKHMRNWGEAAPALFISQQKPSSSFTKLEPIFEESSHEGCEIAKKRSLVLLPLLFSAVLYLFLCKDIVA